MSSFMWVPGFKFWSLPCVTNILSKSCGVWMFSLHVCLFTIYVPGPRGEQEMASDSLELGLEMVISCHVCRKLNPCLPEEQTELFNHWAISPAPSECLCFKGSTRDHRGCTTCLKQQGKYHHKTERLIFFQLRIYLFWAQLILWKPY